MTDASSETGRTSTDEDGPILVAVDFSPDSEAALLWAGRYADRAKAALAILHVIHDPADAPGSYAQKDADQLRSLEESATEMLGKFLTKMQERHSGLNAIENAETSLVKGIPATRILEVAQTLGAQLIVMGSRGRTGLPHLLLGSKAERVVQMSPIPVTIVKAHAADD